MKRLVATVCFMMLVSSLTFAANYTSIGYIDVQKVFKDYKETKKAQEELSKQEESFKKEFEESQKKLEKAEKEGKKTEELEKMKKELEEKLAPKRETLLKLNEQLTGKLQKEILEAVQKVAKKLGIDVVLDKQVVITGGIDLTEMVITELNK
ncbi:MAG: OmpH family outer membrane protein [Candidatus Margulisiibacteriota bacterium]